MPIWPLTAVLSGTAPSHGHSDALSFELHSRGRALLVDPGGFTTRRSERAWRDFFRGTAAHNTIVVDHEDQSLLFGGNRVDSPARAVLHDWATSEYCDFVDGAHDGYWRLSEPIYHRRQIFFAKPDYWILIDTLSGRGKHCFDQFFHLAPDLDAGLDAESKTLHSTRLDRPGITIAPLAAGDLEAELLRGATSPLQGWVSFSWGEKEPAQVLRLRRERAAPLQFCTVLYPHPPGEPVSVKVAPLPLEAEGRGTDPSCTGLRIETATFVDCLVVDRGPAGRCKRFEDWETDARVLYLHRGKDPDGPTRILARGGTELSFKGKSLLGSQETGPFSALEIPGRALLDSSCE